MKVGARSPDLRLRVSAGSAEQIHFARPRCPRARATVFVFGGEELSLASSWQFSYFTCLRFGSGAADTVGDEGRT